VGYARGVDGWAGRVIDNRYVVESVLGRGGMGLVLRAHHKFTGEEVAIKVLRPELELDPHLQERFLNEARAPSAIGHRGIVRVLDAGKAPDGLLYLVMELLVGRSLRIPMARGELAASEIRRIMLELLDALGAAHARGFVHRDLKPDNVFLVAPSDAVKLLDFGIAKVLDGGAARVRTASDATLGTPAYMSPEQLNDPRSVDARTDLWAAGIICYEALSGQLPFRADTAPSLMVAIATKDPDPIRAHMQNVSPAIEAFFARALSRDLNTRFSSTSEMAAALAALPIGGSKPPARSSAAMAATLATDAPPPPAARVAPPQASPRRTRAFALGGIALVAIIATAIIASRTHEKPAQAVESTDSGIAPVTCKAVCAASARCGWGNALCESECESRPGARPCLELAYSNDCDAAARCWFDLGCKGGGPQGTGLCSTAMVCQSKCRPGDFDCGCDCARLMAPSKTLALLRVDTCAINCVFADGCMERLCPNYIEECARQ